VRGLNARVSRPRYQHLPIFAIVLAAAAVTALFSLQATHWAVMTDELQSSKLATSIAETLSPEPQIHGVFYHALSQLYPLLISPFFGLLTVPAAFKATHALNAVLLASAAWPAGLLAHRVTQSWPAAYFASALTAFVPWLVLAATLLTENLAYPVFVWSVLLMHQALARPSVRADAGALLGLLLAFFARTQLLVLALALPLTLVGFELAGYRALRRHPLLVSAYALAGIVAAGLAAGGHLDAVLGTYARTVEGNPFPSGIWHAAAVHFDNVVIGVGIVPFLLACSWALSALLRGRDLDAQAFAVLFVVLVPLITLQAASFDQRFTPGGFTEDRYLLYLAPLFAVGAAAALVDRERRGLTSALLLSFAGAFCALTLVELHPSSAVIFWASPAAAFQDALRSAADLIDVSTRALVGWGSLLVAAALAAVLWRARPLAAIVAVGFVSVAFGFLEAVYVFDRFAVPSTIRPRTIPSVQRDWVDAALADAASVALVPNPNLARDYWWDAEFWNKRVDRVLRIDGDETHTPFPAERFSVEPTSGAVRGLGGAQFLVLASSENRIQLTHSKIVRSAPPLKLIAVGRRPHVDWATSGAYPDGWSRPGRRLSLHLFPPDETLAHEVRLTLRAPPARKGLLRFQVRGSNMMRRGRLAPGETGRLSIPVCVRRAGELTLLSHNGIRLADGRMVGVRVDRIELVEAPESCRPLRNRGARGAG
jgi:hypothetical protein